MSVDHGPAPRLVGTNCTEPVGTPPPVEVTVAFSMTTVPACSVTGALSGGLLSVVVVADLPVAGLGVIWIVAVPDDALWWALPEYLATTVFLAGSTNCAVQDVLRAFRVPWHNLRVPDQNVTVPVGFPPRPFSVADSVMFVWVKPVFGADTTVVVAY